MKNATTIRWINALLFSLSILSIIVLCMGLFFWTSGWVSMRAWDREASKWQSIVAIEKCDSGKMDPALRGSESIPMKGCRLSYVVDGRQYTTKPRDYSISGPRRVFTNIWYLKASPEVISVGRCGTPYVSALASLQAGRVAIGIGAAAFILVFLARKLVGSARPKTQLAPAS
jgi:hypothetical protein